MKKIVLCGHTGSINRGCEAIIKGTQFLFENEGVETVLTTHDLKNDKKIGIKEFKEVIEYTDINEIKKQNILEYIYIQIQDKIFKNKYYMYRDIQKNILKKINDNIALNVGGDTYCYKEKPYISYSLNKYSNKNKIPCFLWGCSIEEENIDQEMLKDLQKYTMIFPRETITYQTLIKKGIPEEKIVLMSDPAFSLEKQEVKLDKDFNNKKVIGLNVSPLVIQSGKQGVIWKNINKIIEFILNETDYSIALIPHVFNGNTEDVKVNNEIYSKYKESGRIININQKYNCKQLKYVISKCSFLIAARTHASIAAYSTGVPTLVLGYSVKSKGIAKDLFGTYDNYVVSAQNITEEDELLNAFKWIQDNEKQIKNQYKKILPEYINRVNKAVSTIKKYI